GGAQGRILAQAQPGGVIGADALVVQDGGHAGGKGHHAGLGVLGLVQHAVGIGKGNRLEVKAGLGAVQHGPELGVCLVQVGAHAGVLAALTRIQKCYFHASSPFSVASQPAIISSKILRRGLTSCSIPATWPDIKLPVSRSPSKTARRREPRVSFSRSARGIFSFSISRYWRAILFFSTRTGAPVVRPVTTVSLAPALIRACL